MEKSVNCRYCNDTGEWVSPGGFGNIYPCLECTSSSTTPNNSTIKATRLKVHSWTGLYHDTPSRTFKYFPLDDKNPTILMAPGQKEQGLILKGLKKYNMYQHSNSLYIHARGSYSVIEIPKGRLFGRLVKVSDGRVLVYSVVQGIKNLADHLRNVRMGAQSGTQLAHSLVRDGSHVSWYPDTQTIFIT